LTIHLASLTEICSSGEEKATSFNKALACAFIEVEKQREKEKTFLFHKEGERMLSLVQVLWPFTITQTSSKDIILFDSLSLLKKVFTNGSIDFCYEFNESIKSCVPSIIGKDELFGWLEKNSRYFRDFRSIKSIEVNGCFKDSKSAQEFVSSMSLVIKQESLESIPLSFVIDSKKAINYLIELTDLKKKSKDDIDILKNSFSLVDSVENKWVMKIHGTISEERKYWDDKIEEIRPDVESKIREFEIQTDRELDWIRTEIENRKKQASQWEAMERHDQALVGSASRKLNQAVQELDIEKDLAFQDSERDTRHMSVLESCVDDSEEELRTARSICSETSQQVSRSKCLLEEKEQEYTNIKNKFNGQIRDEQMRITVLSELREEKTAEIERELSRIIAFFRGIGGDLTNLVEHKRSIINEIDGLAFPLVTFGPELRNEAYIYVPFFIGKLEKNGVSRFVVIPPSKLKNNKSFGEKLGNFFLKQIPAPSEPRNPCYVELSSMLKSLLSMNHSVAKEIYGKTEKANTLACVSSKEMIKNGLQQLNNEQFLNDKSLRKLLLNLELAQEQPLNQYQRSRKNPENSEELTPKVRFICPKCRTNICFETDHCPSCGFRWSQTQKS